MSDEARAHFKAGVAHLKSKSPERYSDAYREFKAAYAASPSWKILGNLGIAADKIERLGEAIDCLQEYLDHGQAEIGDVEATQVRLDIERLRGEVATVALELQGPAPHWIVDKRLGPSGPIENKYGPFEGRVALRVRAGKHEFELASARAGTPAWSVTLLAGDSVKHSFVPESSAAIAFDAAEGPPPVEPQEAAQVEASPSPSHTTAYILWGVGAVAVGATTVLHLKSQSTQNEADGEFERFCPHGADQSEGCVGALANDARAANWRTATLVTGIGAMGALVSGTVLYLLDLKSPPENERGSYGEDDSARLRAWISPTGVGLSGTF